MVQNLGLNSSCFLLKTLLGPSSQGNFLLLYRFQLFQLCLLVLAESNVQYWPSLMPMSTGGQDPHSKGKTSLRLLKGCMDEQTLPRLTSVTVTILNSVLCCDRVVRGQGSALVAPWWLPKRLSHRPCQRLIQHHRFPSLDRVPKSPHTAFWHDSLVTGVRQSQVVRKRIGILWSHQKLTCT